MTAEYQLVQVNTAKMIADLDDPVMSGFVQRLVEINALADNSSGFVWRYQTKEGDATYLRPFDDKRILFNMSVWKTLDDLRNFAYASKHVELLKKKASWFGKLDEVHIVLWWIEKGSIPTVDEALAKLNLIQCKGSTIDAFNFAKSFEK